MDEHQVMELWPFGTSYPGKVQNLYSLLMRAPSISCLRMWFEPYRDWNFLRDLFPHSKQRGGKRSTFCSSEERLGFALRMFGYPLRFMMFITTVIAFLESDLLTHQHTVHKYQYIVKVSQERHPQQNCTTGVPKNRTTRRTTRRRMTSLFEVQPQPGRCDTGPLELPGGYITDQQSRLLAKSYIYIYS